MHYLPTDSSAANPSDAEQVITVIFRLVESTNLAISWLPCEFAFFVPNCKTFVTIFQFIKRNQQSCWTDFSIWRIKNVIVTVIEFTLFLFCMMMRLTTIAVGRKMSGSLVFSELVVDQTILRFNQVEQFTEFYFGWCLVPSITQHRMRFIESILLSHK